MKAEIELNLDSNGRPCIKIRHHDKSNALEQKVLGTFIEAVKKNGMKLCNPSSFADTEGNCWENYEIQIDSKLT